MMAQWTQCKEQVGEALLLFRLGDFYEAFGNDAHTISEALDLTLTKRQETPMCGIPWHASEGYIDRLLLKGFSVAIAEQTGPVGEERPGTKPLMDRKVVRVLTPGTAMQGSFIQETANSLLLSMAFLDGRWGVSCVDVTTALFYAFEVETEEELSREILRLKPKECICSRALRKQHADVFIRVEREIELRATSIPSWTVESTSAVTLLTNHFKTATLDGFGFKDAPAAVCAAGAILYYLKDTLLVPVCHLKTIEFRSTRARMVLDRSTMANLDIFESSSAGRNSSSLFDVINYTKTPMGARLLRSILAAPLTNLEEISARHNSVASCIECIKKEPSSFSLALEYLALIRDLERLMLRVQTGGVGPRDILYLSQCCSPIGPLQKALQGLVHPVLSQAIQSIPSLDALVHRIGQTLTDEPPLRITDGGAIRSGVSAQLDELRAIRHNSHQWLVEYQARLREEFGIKTLKVGYTRAFGYYIEVSRGQSDRMPASFCRRQTLTNAERYISEELKQFEDKVLTAEKKIEGLEEELFEELKAFVSECADTVLHAGRVIAQVDLYISFARLALERSYCRPEMVDRPILSIIGGRHPIAEGQTTTAFIPNNLEMNAQGPSLLLITGPNMAGKSTFIRQAALLVILAQIGSYIPAQEATIGVVDRVFSRVGASDDLFRGQSTFMVEMTETASILNQATPSSLILLDEIGRGTSTYDGVSIAWAVAEYLTRLPNDNPRTLFATHYYELTELEQLFPTVKNMTVAVSEEAGGIRFLYKIIPGKTDRSYGIHVAQLAGLPQTVLQRAQQVLTQLEDRRPRSTPMFVPQDLFTVVVGPPQIEQTKALASHEFLIDLDLVKLSPMDLFLKLVKFKRSLA